MPLLSNKKQKDKTEITLNFQGTSMQDQTLAAEEFTNYFATVGDRCVENHPSRNFTPEECTRHPIVSAISSRWDSNLFSFRKKSVQETLLSLKYSNPNKAIGLDMIPPHVLKTAPEELAGPLTEIFNQFILEKHWPSSWKRGEWIPVFKKEDPLEKSNFRLITLLTAVDFTSYAI